MLLPHPAIDVEHVNSNRWSEKLTLNPKNPRVFLPLTKPLPFEKRGADVELTYIASLIQIPGAVRCGQPRTNIFRWVNWTNYYQFLEECNSKAPSLSSIIAFIIRPMPSATKLEERHQQMSKNVPVCCAPPLISSTWMSVSTWSLVLKRSFSEAQSFWHLSILDFKSPLWVLTVRSVKNNIFFPKLDLKFNRLKDRITCDGQFRIFMNERRSPKRLTTDVINDIGCVLDHW